MKCRHSLRVSGFQVRESNEWELAVCPLKVTALPVGELCEHYMEAQSLLHGGTVNCCRGCVVCTSEHPALSYVSSASLGSILVPQSLKVALRSRSLLCSQLLYTKGQNRKKREAMDSGVPSPSVFSHSHEEAFESRLRVKAHIEVLGLARSDESCCLLCLRLCPGPTLVPSCDHHFLFQVFLM